MNKFYEDYISRGRSLAARAGLSWDVQYDDTGVVVKEQRWNLTKLCNLNQGQVVTVRTLALYEPALAPLNRLRETACLAPMEAGSMPPAWCEFFLAAMLERVLDADLRPKSALDIVGRQIRILATCSGAMSPVDMTADDVQRAYNCALAIGESGKLALDLATTIRTVFDRLYLTDRGPLASYCVPYSDPESVDRHGRAERQGLRQRTHRKTESRKSLAEKVAAEKLPDMDAFWELIRILYCDRPLTSSDAIRFNQLKWLVLTGFRVTENVMVPEHCLVQREYFDYKGRNSAARGGIATSLRTRHFAEKQTTDKDRNGFVLVEDFQDIPEMFADPVRAIVDDTRRLTAQMRDRLKRQVETGRLLPEYSLDDIVPDWELYLRLSGNIQLGANPLPWRLVQQYRETFSTDDLDKLRDHQIAAYHRQPNRRIREYFEGWCKKASYVVFRDMNGVPTTNRGHGKYAFRVGDIERYVDEHLSTKKPALQPMQLSSGGLHYPHEFLFLYPSRSVVEDRDDGVLDIGRYAFVGIGSHMDLQFHLGANTPNLFTKYGSEETKGFKINPHAIRHLQNDELFRQGVNDALITMRFGRKSAVQSHVYDHRSLAEHLDYMEVPGGEEPAMTGNAFKALHLIKTGQAAGLIVDEFRRVQSLQGDEAAFEYLNAEAAGLHATPYGFCLSSLTVDPCAKNLECTNSCKHFARTGLPSETGVLIDLRDRLVKIITQQESEGLTTRGAKNQIDHAKVRLEGVERALLTKPDSPVSPQGEDRFRRFAVTRSQKVS